MDLETVSTLFVFGLIGFAVLVFAVWVTGAAINNTPQAIEKRRVRAAKNDLEIEADRRQMELDLKLREWQHTKSLADLDRHAVRLERELDAMHTDPAEQPA